MTKQEKRDEQVTKILKDNKLDFEIIKKPLKADGGWKTPYFGLFHGKTKECINTCKEGYHVSQNKEIIELVVGGMENFTKELTVTKAGSLHGGRKVFIQLEVAGTSKVGDDDVKRFVTVLDSNDGSTGLSVGIGDLTASCLNQFYKFYKRGNIKFRHTATLEEKIQTIPQLIEMALSESMRQMKVYRKFQSTELTKNMADALVKEILGHDRFYTPASVLNSMTPKAASHMAGLYETIEGELAAKGNNFWGLHSGITKWTTHVKITPKRANGLYETLMAGTSYAMAMKSFRFCAKEVGVKLDKELLVLS